MTFLQGQDSGEEEQPRATPVRLRRGLGCREEAGRGPAGVKMLGHPSPGTMEAQWWMEVKVCGTTR